LKQEAVNFAYNYENDCLGGEKDMISADDNVEELLEKYPGINRFLMKRGIVCVQCGETFWGPLRQLIEEKGMDVDQIVNELNANFENGN
jgi:hypothetical protein